MKSFLWGMVGTFVNNFLVLLEVTRIVFKGRSALSPIRPLTRQCPYET